MTDEELRSMQEVETLLVDLTRHQGWGALVEYANERMKGVKQGLLNGTIKTHEQYLRDAHWCRGMHDLLDARHAVSGIVANEIARRRERELASNDA